MPSQPAKPPPKPTQKPQKPPTQPAKKPSVQTAQHSSLQDYGVNQQLSLDVIGQAKGSQIHVHVQKLHTPRTLSCTMVVDIVNGGGQLPKTAFLKLFDRRFAEQHRVDIGVERWTKKVEEAYIAEVESGAINGFLHSLRTVPNYLDTTGDRWNDGQNEAYVAETMLNCFQSETAAYSALRSYQGNQIPHLIAAVELKLTPPPNAKGVSPPDSEHFHIKGVLLEYIQGFSMSDLATHAPNTAWQGIVDQGLAIVRSLGDHGILNKDVRSGNMMVVANGGKFRVVMIDFGICIFRRNGESDQEWGRAKWDEDEEGAIGQQMRLKLKAHGFSLHYEPSNKYLKWASKG